MRSGLLFVLFVLFLSVLAPSVTTAGAQSTTPVDCTFPFTETDATGETVTVSAEPTRIVSLGPSTAQTLWEIGARDKVVGVSKYAGYLEGAASKENVSGSGQTFVVAEKVVALEPALVLAPNIITNDTVGTLRNAGLTVYRFEAASSLEDVITKTALIGRLSGECEGATDTIDWMEAEIATVRTAVEGEPRPLALYTFHGYTAGDGTFIHEIITTAGAENMAAAVGITGYGQLNQEVVVQQNPDWIVLNSDAPRVPATAAYNGTTAVQRDQIVVLDENYISQPAPRIVYSIRKLAKAFHPDAYAAANATATPTATPTASPHPPITPTSSPVPTTTESPGQPGFGLVSLLGALVVLLLLRWP